MINIPGQETLRHLSPVYLQNLRIFFKITSFMFDVFSKLDLDLKLENSRVICSNERTELL